MLDDLLAPLAAHDWAKHQIPILRGKFENYTQQRPYHLDICDDPNTHEKLLVFRSLGAHDMPLDVEAGLLISALRTSLDLLFATLIRRNGKKPPRNRGFPPRQSVEEFNDAVQEIKEENSLSDVELAQIKSLKPYERVNDISLYVLAKLDNLRKHERLLKSFRTPDRFVCRCLSLALRTNGIISKTRPSCFDFPPTPLLFRLKKIQASPFR